MDRKELKKIIKDKAIRAYHAGKKDRTASASGLDWEKIAPFAEHLLRTKKLIKLQFDGSFIYVKYYI